MFQFPQIIYGLTHRKLAQDQDLIKQVQALLDGGLKLIQYREKNLPDQEFEKEARRIQQIISHHSGQFIINDRVTMAIKIGADGIHIGQSDYYRFGETPARALDNIRWAYQKKWHQDLIIGLSVSSYAEAHIAQASGADYIGVGAIYATPSKPDATVVSPQDLKKIITEIKIPKVAIGGINVQNYKLILKMGFESISMLRGLLDPKNTGSGSYDTVKDNVERFIYENR